MREKLDTRLLEEVGYLRIPILTNLRKIAIYVFYQPKRNIGLIFGIFI
ncbi:MAG: hypothetical protein VKL59_09040 [Nostocaceae cyanobacterium]|nr:hypothetical protein [Nostocaceae cyanobacterium]